MSHFSLSYMSFSRMLHVFDCMSSAHALCFFFFFHIHASFSSQSPCFDVFTHWFAHTRTIPPYTVCLYFSVVHQQCHQNSCTIESYLSCCADTRPSAATSQVTAARHTESAFAYHIFFICFFSCFLFRSAAFHTFWLMPRCAYCSFSPSGFLRDGVSRQRLRYLPRYGMLRPALRSCALAIAFAFCFPPSDDVAHRAPSSTPSLFSPPYLFPATIFSGDALIHCRFSTAATPRLSSSFERTPLLFTMVRLLSTPTEPSPPPSFHFFLFSTFSSLFLSFHVTYSSALISWCCRFRPQLLHSQMPSSSPSTDFFFFAIRATRDLHFLSFAYHFTVSSFRHLFHSFRFLRHFRPDFTVTPSSFRLSSPSLSSFIFISSHHSIRPRFAAIICHTSAATATIFFSFFLRHAFLRDALPSQ